MDPGSVGRKVNSKVRVAAMTVITWFVVRSVVGIKVVRIIMTVSLNPMVPVHISVLFPLTILVMVPMTRPSTAIPCLRWRRPSDQKYCQKSNYYNLTDVFHFDSPFTRNSRRGEEKGYGFIKAKVAWRVEYCNIPNWSFGHPTLRAGPRFLDSKCRGFRCQGKEIKMLQPVENPVLNEAPEGDTAYRAEALEAKAGMLNPQSFRRCRELFAGRAVGANVPYRDLVVAA
jgi:hypothetical protein